MHTIWSNVDVMELLEVGAAVFVNMSQILDGELDSMNKLAIIMNICGIKQPENIPFYLDNIRAILRNTMVKDEFGVKVILSSCMSSETAVSQLYGYFGHQLCYNVVQEILPVNITFNLAIKNAVKYFGEFEGYMYIESGVSFWNCYQGIKKLYEAMQSGPYGIVHAKASNDNGYEWCLRGNSLGDITSPTVLAPGVAVNMHAAIYHNDLFKAYGGCAPDIFCSDASESVHPFMCAGVGRKILIYPEVEVLHVGMVDGASSGHRGTEKPFTMRKDIPRKDDMKILYERGKQFGFGFEECQPNFGCLHDPDCYDEKGNAKDQAGLKQFIRDEIFLQQGEFHYDMIKHHWIP